MDSGAWLVMLVVTFITPQGQWNIEHSEAMPSVKVCLEEAERFLDAYPPSPGHVEVAGVMARCVKKIAPEEHS